MLKTKPKPKTEEEIILDIDTISFSGADMYLRCGEQYRRRYVLGQKVPPGIALVEGSSYHAALQAANLYKKQKGRQLPARRLIEVHAEEMEKLIKPHKKGFVWDKVTPNINTAYRRSKILLPDYSLNFDPHIEPDWVEQPVLKELNVEGTKFKVSGVLDLTTKKAKKKGKFSGKTWDYKTSSGAKSQADVDDSLQLSIYAFASNLMDVGFINFVKTQNPYIQCLTSHRSPSDIAWAHQILKRVFEGVKSGVFQLTAPSRFAWHCSEKFCGYWKDCKGKYIKLRE